MSHEKNNGNFWVGFFLGGLLGAVLIFILGTKEGKKAAKNLLDQKDLFEEEIEEKINLLAQKGEALLSQAQGIKSRVVKEIEEGKKTVSHTLLEKADSALTQIENLQKKGVEVTKDVHHKYFTRNGKKLASK